MLQLEWQLMLHSVTPASLLGTGKEESAALPFPKGQISQVPVADKYLPSGHLRQLLAAGPSHIKQVEWQTLQAKPEVVAETGRLVSAFLPVPAPQAVQTPDPW